MKQSGFYRVKVLLVMMLFSCRNEESPKSSLNSQFQIKYGETVVLSATNESPNFIVNFNKVVDERCDCSLCYPNGNIYLYFLFKSGNTSVSRKFTRLPCLPLDLAPNDSNMDIQIFLGQKFGLVNVTGSGPDKYIAKLIAIP